MFPLAGKKFPTDNDELVQSIEGALGTVLELPKGGAAVTVSGDKFPVIKRLKVDLSGATVNANEPPDKPKPTGKREEGIEVDQLDVVGHPIQYGSSKLNLDLKAKGVRFDFGKGKGGQLLLILTGAREGKVEAKISKKDLEAVLREVATVAAKQQGVAIQELDLNLKSAGAQSVEADVRVKAKKMLMSGVIHIHGRLDIDDELNATVSGLSCTGEGMVGNMVAPMVQGKLKGFEGKKTPLMALSLGDVSLRDLKMSAKDPLLVSATFGEA